MDKVIADLIKKCTKNEEKIEIYKEYKKTYNLLQNILLSAITSNLKKFSTYINECSVEKLLTFLVISSNYENDPKKMYDVAESLVYLTNLKDVAEKLKLFFFVSLNMYKENINEENKEIAEKQKKSSEEAIKCLLGQEHLENIESFADFEEALIMYKATIQYKRVKASLDKYKNEYLLATVIAMKLIHEIDMLTVEKEPIDALGVFICLLKEIIMIVEEKILDNYEKSIKNIMKENKKLKEKLRTLINISDKLDVEIISESQGLNLIKKLKIDDKSSVNILEEILISNTNIIRNKVQQLPSDKKYKFLFSKYKYDYDKIDEENKKIILQKDIKYLDEILQKISNLGIYLSYINLCHVIDKGFNKEEEKIKTLLNKSYIDNKYINDNINILIDSKDLEKLQNNINILTENNIYDKMSYKEKNKFLSYDPNYINSIIKLYKKYGINLEGQDAKLEKILDEKNFDIIDSLIEEDIDQNIINKIIFTEDIDNIVKRIHINNLIGTPSTTKNDITEEVKNENAFFVPNASLDKLCCVNKELQNKNIEEILKNANRLKISTDINKNQIIFFLDNNYLENSNYNISGNIISRNKVLRNLEALIENDTITTVNHSIEDIIFNIIVYNAKLSTEEINQIKEEIYTKKTVKYKI